MNPNPELVPPTHHITWPEQNPFQMPAGHCFEVEMSANKLILIINKHEHKHK